jgi:RNA polymerase sigma-70 factor, ECF subfamily
MTGLQQFIQRQQDLHLVRNIKAGDQQAFRTLVERYQRRIYALARGLVVSHSVAEDVTQETFIKVWRHLDRFDEEYPLYPWLRRITVNTALSALHGAAERKNVPLDERQADETLVDQQMERHEMLERVQREVAHLPEEQRLVFVLRTQQEMSYEEIAEYLQISVGTVMSRLHRGRMYLKERLRNYV